MGKTTEQRLRAIEADVQAVRLFLAEWLRHQADPGTMEAWHARLTARIEAGEDEPERRAEIIAALDRLVTHLVRIARLTQQRPPPGS